MNNEQRETELSTWSSAKKGHDPSAEFIKGYKITDVEFSEYEGCPTFMIANINSTNDIGYNLSRMEIIVQAAHEANVDVLVLPELSISGYIWKTDNRAEVLDQLKAGSNRRPKVKRVLDNIRSGLVDRGDGLKMVFFSNVRMGKHRDEIYDSTYVMTPNADYNSTFYDKIFLTPIEKEFFHRGSGRRLVLDTRWGKMGIMMCYDLCFVGLGRRYAFDDGVDVIIVPSAWRMEAVRNYPLLNLQIDNYYQFIWRLMHSALAAHNQVWSIGANCVGVFEKTGGRFCGESGIWSPSGIPLVRASHEEEELIVIRHLEIQGHMRYQAKEDFDYSLDFNEVYREIADIKPRWVLP